MIRIRITNATIGILLGLVLISAATFFLWTKVIRPDLLYEMHYDYKVFFSGQYSGGELQLAEVDMIVHGGSKENELRFTEKPWTLTAFVFKGVEYDTSEPDFETLKQLGETSVFEKGNGSHYTIRNSGFGLYISLEHDMVCDWFFRCSFNEEKEPATHSASTPPWARRGRWCRHC